MDESERHATLDEALDEMIDVGRLWARHGLEVGRSALETSARTLDRTARALSTLSDRIGDDRDRPEPGEAA